MDREVEKAAELALGSALQALKFWGEGLYSLELDVGLVQKVGVKKPTEEEVQAGGYKGAAQKGDTEPCGGHIACTCLALPWAQITLTGAKIMQIPDLVFWDLLKDLTQDRHQQHLKLVVAAWNRSSPTLWGIFCLCRSGCSLASLKHEPFPSQGQPCVICDGSPQPSQARREKTTPV